MGILDDYTWVVWLTRDGKWHCSAEGGYDHYADELARRHASGLAGFSNGTADFIGTAVATYCVHAPYRYRAIKIAKEAHKNRKFIRVVDKVEPIGVRVRITSGGIE